MSEHPVGSASIGGRTVWRHPCRTDGSYSGRDRHRGRLDSDRFIQNHPRVPPKPAWHVAMPSVFGRRSRPLSSAQRLLHRDVEAVDDLPDVARLRRRLVGQHRHGQLNEIPRGHLGEVGSAGSGRLGKKPSQAHVGSRQARHVPHGASSPGTCAGRVAWCALLHRGAGQRFLGPVRFRT